MIYGFYGTGETLAVGAADTAVEYDDFVKSLLRTKADLVCTQPDFDEFIITYNDFKLSPYIFSFKTKKDMDDFVQSNKIKICPRFYVADKQKEMVTVKDDYFADKRTLGEIYGLNEFDPWDTRTEEEKQQDEKYKKIADKAKKRGDMTGESFTQSSEPTLQVDSIRASKDSDGNIIIDNILAYKGIYSDTIEEQVIEKFYRIEFESPVQKSALKINIQNHLSDDGSVVTADSVLAHRIALYFNNEQNVKLFENGLLIEPDEKIAAAVVRNTVGIDKIYYKIFIENVRLKTVTEKVSRLILNKSIDSGETKDGCWLIFSAKPPAMMVETSLKDFEFICKIFPVNPLGEQLVPDGIDLFEEKPFIEPPRVWNDRCHELDTMTKEQREQNHKTLDGKEFLFSGKYIDAQIGCVVYITPKSYFEKTDEAWKDFLNIGSILPSDLKEIRPGVFQTRSRDWMNLSNEMQNRNFIESMSFQLYVNLLG